MISEEIKGHLKILASAAWIFATALTIAIIAYHLGAFKSVATGYFWYDVRRLLHFIYELLIVPCCLFYAGVGLVKLILSWLPEKEEQVPDSVKELREQCSWLDRCIDELKGTQHNVIVRVQALEAKMTVICSILSLNKSEELQQSTTDVLKDC